ncbi:MAG: hypothetical protein C0469_05595 [Cyanobacteria bacterium DS2.3.42]|nr:hypothetical protein [Cyanobacteria bacterium DS2.3.42]
MKKQVSTKNFGKTAVPVILLLATTFTLTTNLSASSQTETNPTNAPAATPINPPVGFQVVAPGVRPAEWKFQNEQEWIVDSIGRDIAEMLGYAKYSKDAKEKFSAKDVEFTTKTANLSTNSYEYKLSFKDAQSPLEYKFSLQEYAWSPINYEPLAKQIMTSLKLTPSEPSAIPDDFLKNLSKADFPALFVENTRISKALSANPLDASLHEQAALLQGVFNMLEICGIFSDTRAPLDRMTAHLAMAKALNKDKLSNVGKIANIALESMSCRDAVAVALIEEAEKLPMSPVEKSFLRAVKIRSTTNYRYFNEAEKTPIEEYQYGLRLAQSRGIEETMETVAQRHGNLSIQWRRILASGPASVQTGHILQAHMVSAELFDFMKSRNAYKNVNDQNLQSYISELNLPSTRCLTPVFNAGDFPLTVLSWDDVAAFYSRHLAEAVSEEYLFNERMYAVKELAQQTKANAKKLFSGLKLMPLITAHFSPAHAEKDQFLADLQNLFINNPELCTAHHWNMMVETTKTYAPNAVLVEPELWFDPPMPMGTVYYFRDMLKNCKKNLAELTEWRRLCPYSPMLNTAWAEKKYGPHPTGDQYREAFGPMADFNVQAMRWIAWAENANPEKFIPMMEKMAKEDPNLYLELGEYCVLHNKPEQAAAYYEKGIKVCENAVHVSNVCDWLIQYRYEHGQKEKAAELAQFAAEVYSARGLISLARHNERLCKLSEAEETYRKVLGRYGYKWPLAAFYIRYSDKDKKYAQEASVLTKEIFPTGMKKVTLASFTEKPKRGLEVESTDWLTDKAPIERKDIIVAVNGYEVINKDQFDLARNLATKPSAWVIYWHEKEFKETTRQTVNNNYLRLDVKALESPEEKAKKAAEAKPSADALTKLKDNMMKQAQEMQKQNLPPEEMLKRLFQQNNIPQSMYQSLLQQNAAKASPVGKPAAGKAPAKGSAKK